MEIYKDDPNPVVKLNVPILAAGTQMDVKAIINGELLYDFPAVESLAGGYQVTLPWHLMRNDREFYITWEFGYTEAGLARLFKETTFVQLVTPILPLSEVQTISGTTEQEAKDLEKRVRYIIQSYTGQNFGRYRGTLVIKNNFYHVPLLEIESEVVEVTGNFGIKHAMFDHDKFVAPIYAPPKSPRVLSKVITGLWGYWEVPEPVKQAAKLLVNDYACDESLWRDKHIKVMKASDWSIEFNPSALTGTGNVQADQLLQEYRYKSMAVI